MVERRESISKMCESSTLKHRAVVVGDLSPYQRGRRCRENSDVEDPSRKRFSKTKGQQYTT